jgi:putative protease
VQGSATNADAINLYHQQFNIQRAVLPRVLSLEQVKQVVQRTRWRSRSSASAACA